MCDNSDVANAAPAAAYSCLVQQDDAGPKLGTATCVCVCVYVGGCVCVWAACVRAVSADTQLVCVHVCACMCVRRF